MKYTLPIIHPKKTSPLLEPYLQKVRGKIIPGAHRIHQLLKKQINNDILNIPSVLITGSNGKGTTCAFIESILRHHGFKTGLYTSPHLIHPSERIRIQGVPISEGMLEEQLSLIITEAKNNLPDASLFEILTATALLVFWKEKIDFLICEVGLGGLFDSTNCLSPLVSVITTVSLEHTDILGQTEEQIAADKAFISRRNRPIILGNLSENALIGVLKTTQNTGAHVKLISDTLQKEFFDIYHTIESHSDNKFHFAKMNLINLRVALHAVQEIQNELNIHFSYKRFIKYENLCSGIVNTEWPGRFDIRQIGNRTVIFDASHNPDGFEFFLNEYKTSMFAKLKCTLIFASLNDKDWKRTLPKIPEIAHSVYITEFHSVRAELSKNILEYFNTMQLPLAHEHFKVCSYDNYEEALERAMNQEPNSPIVITGSIAFIGLALERFGLSFFSRN